MVSCHFGCPFTFIQDTTKICQKFVISEPWLLLQLLMYKYMVVLGEIIHNVFSEE